MRRRDPGLLVACRPRFAEWDVDFAMADGRSWLLGPEGVGVFYVAERAGDRLRPLELVWASVLHRLEWENRELVWDDSPAASEGGSQQDGRAPLRFRRARNNRCSTRHCERAAHVDGLCARLVDGLAAIDRARKCCRTDRRREDLALSRSVDGLPPDEAAQRLTEANFT